MATVSAGPGDDIPSAAAIATPPSPPPHDTLTLAVPENPLTRPSTNGSSASHETSETQATQDTTGVASARDAPGPGHLHSSPTVAFDSSVNDSLKFDAHDLAIDKDSLRITDRAAKRKKSPFKFGGQGGRSSAVRIIPLYHVLWAEVSTDGRSLVIDYAEKPSRNTLVATKLAIPIPENPDLPHDAISIWIKNLLDRAYGAAPRRRRAYVLVNPHAGPGGADRKWETEAKPLFAAARMPMDVHVTKRSGEALELCEKLDIAKYDMIVVCSGDGLVHEVLNGLGRRPDGGRALASVAIAHVPYGSGNGMACNLYGSHRPMPAALGVVKGVATPMDLVSVTQGDARILSFLSQAIGIIAEADLGTENMRWMGSHRFTYGVVERIMGKKLYPCDLAVKVEVPDKQAVREQYARARTGLDKALADFKKLAVNGKESKDGPVNGSSETEKNGAVAPETPADDGAAQPEPTEGLPPLKYGTVNDEIPEDWERISLDKLGNFYCGNMAYMAPDVNFFPAAMINDGLMDMLLADGDLPPIKAINLFTSVESGGFFDNPLVAYRKVSAYRITPRDPKEGYISIDGERVRWAPLQAEVHKGLCRVITRTGAYEAPGPIGWDKISLAEKTAAP